MQVQFLKHFSKDLDSIDQAKDKQAILEIIDSVKKIESLDQITGLKKLVGFSDVYRIRSGN